MDIWDFRKISAWAGLGNRNSSYQSLSSCGPGFS